MHNNLHRQSNCSDIDQYIGKQVQSIRRSKGISLEAVAQSLDLSIEDYHKAEAGKLRFSASDMFDLRRHFDIPLSYFFSHEGEYFSDIILDETEMANVFHYFANIESPKARAHILEQMKLASSVF